MLQITVDPSHLTRAERETIAAFLISYPYPFADGNDEPAEIPTFTTGDEPEAIEAGDEEAAAIFGAAAPAPEEVFSAAAPAPAGGPVLVPSPPTPAAPPTAENDRFDKAGLPWDERIHASSRAKTADGSWRKKRGIDDGTVAQVEGELRALMALPAAAQAAPVPAPAGVPAPPVAADPAQDRQAYVSLLSIASAAINAKKLTAEQLAAAVIAVGVPSLPLLANRLDLVPQVMTAVKAIIE